MSSKLNYSIVIMTSDKYSKVLKDFKIFFLKFWPKSYQDLIVVLELDSIKEDEFYNLTTNSHDWSKRLDIALNNVSTDYVIILLEDYFIFNEVYDSELQTLLEFMKFYSVNYLSWTSNINSYPLKLELRYNHSDQSFYKAKSTLLNYEYLVNAHGIYNTKSLKKLLRRNENPWQFETNASLRAHLDKNFQSYRVNGEINPFQHLKGGVLIKGVLSQEAKLVFKETKFKPSFKSIEISSGKESFFQNKVLTSIKLKIYKYLNIFLGKF